MYSLILVIISEIFIPEKPLGLPLAISDALV
jgi:hypothetical protein